MSKYHALKIFMSNCQKDCMLQIFSKFWSGKYGLQSVGSEFALAIERAPYVYFKYISRLDSRHN